MDQSSSVLTTALKNPIAALLLALMFVLGNWWVNSRRLDANEEAIHTLQVQSIPKSQADERYNEIIRRLDRIENKVERHIEQEKGK